MTRKLSTLTSAVTSKPITLACAATLVPFPVSSPRLVSFRIHFTLLLPLAGTPRAHEVTARTRVFESR